jgi:predicted transposase/invertase (TIGR01784 family)
MAMPEIMEWFKQEGIEEGIEQGIRTSKLEDARKMLDRGCDWAFVTDITGIKPEDLETV